MFLLKLLRAMIAARSRKLRPSLPPAFSSAIVSSDLNPRGSVLADGELWTAEALHRTTIRHQTKVIIVGFQDHLVLVTESM